MGKFSKLTLNTQAEAWSRREEVDGRLRRSIENLEAIRSVGAIFEKILYKAIAARTEPVE